MLLYTALSQLLVARCVVSLGWYQRQLWLLINKRKAEIDICFPVLMPTETQIRLGAIGLATNAFRWP